MTPSSAASADLNPALGQGSQVLCIGAEHPSLPGHFPGRPVVPGVLILDRVRALLAAEFPLLRVQRLIQVKFLRPLLPEQSAIIHWQSESTSETERRVKFRLEDDQGILASGDLRLAVPAAAPTDESGHER